MAKPTTLRWHKLSIWVGDGASPEDFTSQTCGLVTKGISFSTETGDVTVADCDDPDLPSWIERVPRSFSATVSGAGTLAEETFAFWKNWFLSGEAKNARIPLELATSPGYFFGAWIITAFELTGNEGDGKVQVSVSLQNDGQIQWTTGAP